jgi:hypothetical protein
MGGAALSHLGVRRYNSDEFYQLAKELVPLVKEAFNTEVELTKSYKNKPDFGDMDLLVLNTGNLGMIEEVIRKNFCPRDIHHNGNCYSFDYKDLQIDLIITPLSNWETSKVFFSYNDLGNLMGKIYHKFGLKYGYDGVKYIHRIDDKKLGDFVVTKDMKKAWEFIGCSWDRYEKGFDEMEDIFNYIIESPYFDYKSFHMENLNAINRKRNKRRKVYQLFLKYIETNNITKSNVWAKDKSEYWNQIGNFFPESNFIENVKDFQEKERVKRELHFKFNGKLIMDRFSELRGEILGKAIKNFKSRFEDFDQYVTDNTPESIMEDFRKSLIELPVI